MDKFPDFINDKQLAKWSFLSVFKGSCKPAMSQILQTDSLEHNFLIWNQWHLIITEVRVDLNSLRFHCPNFSAAMFNKLAFVQSLVYLEENIYICNECLDVPQLLVFHSAVQTWSPPHVACCLWRHNSCLCPCQPDTAQRDRWTRCYSLLSRKAHPVVTTSS